MNEQPYLNHIARRLPLEQSADADTNQQYSDKIDLHSKDVADSACFAQEPLLEAIDDKCVHVIRKRVGDNNP